MFNCECLLNYTLFCLLITLPNGYIVYVSESVCVNVKAYESVKVFTRKATTTLWQGTESAVLTQINQSGNNTPNNDTGTSLLHYTDEQYFSPKNQAAVEVSWS